MATLAQLLDDVGLAPVEADHDAAERTVRWVHICDLEDPRPWLTADAMLLTTGTQIAEGPAGAAFVARVAEAGGVALGLGLGFRHVEPPAAVVEACRQHDVVLVALPYAFPFIQLTQAASRRIVSAEYAALRAATATQDRLERLVLRGAGLPALLGALAEETGRAVGVVDQDGVVRARGGSAAALATAVAALDADDSDGQDARGGPVAVAVPEPDATTSRLRLVAAAPAGPGGAPAAVVRLAVRQAATVVALELLRERSVQDVGDQFDGHLLAEALRGSLPPEELRGRLRRRGLREPLAVALVRPAAGAGAALRRPLLSALRRDDDAGAIASLDQDRLHVVLGAADPVEALRAALAACGEPGAGAAAGVSRRLPLEALRRAATEARLSLDLVELDPRAPGAEHPAPDPAAPRVSGLRSGGATDLLLALGDRAGIRALADHHLGELADADADGELQRSLRAFLEHHGQWERAARELFCHRNTLRYRMRRVEELTGRRLDRAEDRVELWLALRARELSSA